MRDGTLYFMALLLLNILEIVINIRYEDPQNPATYITNFLPPISSILVSRFILNLRQASLGSMGLNTTSHSTLNKLNFTPRLVGNIGAEVQHTSLVFENVAEDSMEDEQDISVDLPTLTVARISNTST
ncbi:uncharacterized protein LAESUDRAFT_428172 [Laetiporus sulphureus 93-53]|uniref:DUF1746 domain-containing protein n=1 Tax=Laetiporus sulphureus 93-53 TaxID=1314785 RepID=A0A165GLE2_9APHY|nr:uncharacterized protein LAESUDRAFT_428172 [Laetiporus sulphureus 93-53]KZT10512.1 hypothetical protein LAESUDRAFT_428172 [Laetiporus sulphureus 93-53]